MANVSQANQTVSQSDPRNRSFSSGLASVARAGYLVRVRRGAASRSCPDSSGTGPPVSPGESRGMNKELP